jgi:hypothetical protein
MPAKQPSCEILVSGGLSFVNQPPNSNYRALRLDSSENHLYWESTYQNIIRDNKDFSDFFPNAEFSDNGDMVTFSKYINSVEVLAKSRPMRPGESINKAEWQRFLDSWHGFKALAERPDVPEDIVKFIKTFGLPPFDIFPTAYRIYKPHWYSKPKLIILWGLEPASPSEIPNVYDAEAVISQIAGYVEPEASQSGFNYSRLIKFLVLGLVALFLFLLIMWILIPTPKADFQVSPKVNNPTKISNTSQLSTPNSNYVITSYAWIIEKGTPSESKEFEPVVTWKSTGSSKVTLEARRSILGGLLYKKDEKTKSINVMAEPVIENPKIPKRLSDKNGSELNRKPENNLPDALPLTPEENDLGRNRDNILEPLNPSETMEVLPPKGKGLEPNNNFKNDNSLPKPDDQNPQIPEPDNGKGANKDEVPMESPSPSPGKKGNGAEPPRAINPKPKSPQTSVSTPRISIINQSMLSDGSESQKIEFSVDSNSKIQLIALSIDGSVIDFKNNQKTFISILKKGVHRLELSYSDLDGNSDTIIQEINVDSRPDNKLSPPIKKIKQGDLELPDESQPKQSEENFNKKLA